jgi:hypothetical protein
MSLARALKAMLSMADYGTNYGATAAKQIGPLAGPNK